MDTNSIQRISNAAYYRALTTKIAAATEDSDTDSKSVDSASGASTPSASGASTADSSEFDAALENFLPGKDGQSISEEELFAAAVGERIGTLKGSEALDKYKTALSSAIGGAAASGGFVPYEKATL